MLKTYKEHDLTPYNTFGIAAKADYFLEFTESVSLRTFLAHPPHYFKDIFILGGGSNVLFTQDYHGCIIHPANKGIRITVEDSDSVNVEVQAGEEWDVFVQWAASHNLGGVENLAGIPGRVGASPVQNIGAYGSESRDSIVSVETMDLALGEIEHLTARECNFGYRDSIFKHQHAGKRIILSVLFKLTKKPELNTSYPLVEETLAKYRIKNPYTLGRTIREIRDSKLPEPWQLGNAGSFFKNPIVSQELADQLMIEHPNIPQYPADGDNVKLAAGWLIEKAGWKGRRKGNVGVHEKQALILVNYGGATGNEIVDLSKEVQAAVLEKFGVELQPEVTIV